VQPLGGPAEMKLGGHRDERLKLAQFHSLTVPRRARTAQENGARAAKAALMPPKTVRYCSPFLGPGRESGAIRDSSVKTKNTFASCVLIARDRVTQAGVAADSSARPNGAFPSCPFFPRGSDTRMKAWRGGPRRPEAAGVAP